MKDPREELRDIVQEAFLRGLKCAGDLARNMPVDDATTFSGMTTEESASFVRDFFVNAIDEMVEQHKI